MSNGSKIEVKFAYLSTIAAPHQIRLCEALNKHFSAKFFFYEHLGSARPAWWKVKLGPNCTVMKGLVFKRNSKYVNSKVVEYLEAYDPDILMIGGFSIPSNYFAYLWAKKKRKKVIIFTEISRRRNGELRSLGVVWRLIRYLYRDIDYVFASNSDAKNQFEIELGFGKKVVEFRYASDIDGYFDHALRIDKPTYTYLFANRLIEIYNPILAIEIFAELLRLSPGSKLLINNQGPLRAQIVSLVEDKGLGLSVEFLSDIKRWEDLPKVYERSDILILPATFSNGNFSIIEAMASGMGIVVSSKVNGHSDTLRNDRNCFIVLPNRDEFVGAVQKYTKDPSLLLKHGEVSRELVRPLSAVGTAKSLEELLANLDLF